MTVAKLNDRIDTHYDKTDNSSKLMRMGTGGVLTLTTTETTIAALLLAGAAPAVASGGGDGCNPQRPSNYPTHYLDGMYQPKAPPPMDGVTADILNYSPYVSPQSDATSEWVMLLPGSPTTQGYSQVGWYEAPHSARYIFVEYTPLDNGSSGYTLQLFPPDPINSQSDYKVDYNDQTQVYSFYDGSHYLTNNHFGLNLPAPDTAQVFAELHDEASQEPGGYAQLHYNYASNAYIHYNGQWKAMTAQFQNDAYPFGLEAPYQGNTYKTWDSACPY